MSDLGLLLGYLVGLLTGALCLWLWLAAGRPDRRTVVLRRLARLKRRERHP